jgi:hypothetical protein
MRFLAAPPLRYVEGLRPSLGFGNLPAMVRAPANAGRTNIAWGAAPKVQTPGIAVIRLQPTTRATDIVFEYKQID